MADAFSRDDVKKLMGGKYILFFGDSNVRALYKDFVTLYNKNRLTSEAALRKKLEPSFEGDSLLHNVGLTKGRTYREHRNFMSDQTVIEFFFVTKCLCADVSNTLDEISKGERLAPDVIVMNSTLWDVTRWGAKSVSLFKENLPKLISLFKKCLPENTLVIWLTTPPLSKVRGGFLIPEVEFLEHTIRFEAMEANLYAHNLFSSNGLDVLDFNFFLTMNVHRRNQDGIHWRAKAVRYMTNLLLTHICVAWGKELPGRFESVQLTKLGEDLEKPLEKTSQESVLSTNVPSQQPMKTEEKPRIKAKYRLGKSIVQPCHDSAPLEDLRTRLRKSQNSTVSNNNKKNSKNDNYVPSSLQNGSRQHNRSSKGSIRTPPNCGYEDDHDDRTQLNRRGRKRGNNRNYPSQYQKVNIRYNPYERPRCPW